MTDRLSRHLIWLLLVVTPIAIAQSPASVLLDNLTWTELRDAIKAGKTTIIVPIGGTEQNGPHMALGKHNVRVKVLAERIARTLGNALVAPVIAYVPEGGVDPPTAHMKFPGTITVPDAVFEKVLEYAGRSFKLHGFRDVVFIGDHGSYQKLEQAVADRLNKEWTATAARAHAILAYYRVTETEYRETLRNRGFADTEIGTHAGLADTALTLAIDPHLVRADRLRSGVGLDSAQGVYGDPRRATAEIGQAGVELIVAHTADAIRKAVKR